MIDYIHCPDCAGLDFTERNTLDTFKYGDLECKAVYPVITCDQCGLQWSDDRGETARTEATIYALAQEVKEINKMIEEKDYEHLIFNNMVRTTLRISSEHRTDGSMDRELGARSLNKSRIREMLYAKEIREIETLVSSLYFEGWEEETYNKLLTICRDLLK